MLIIEQHYPCGHYLDGPVHAACPKYARPLYGHLIPACFRVSHPQQFTGHWGVMVLVSRVCL
jgi:hypothetical protein